MKKTMVCALALSLSVGLAQARSTEPLIEPSRVLLVSSQDRSLDQIKQAIVRGGARHNWTLAKDEPGKLTLKYNKQNKHEVVVDVSYDQQGFQIRYVSSLNMKHDSATGEIHPFYNRWVSNLSQAISMEINQLSLQ